MNRVRYFPTVLILLASLAFCTTPAWSTAVCGDANGDGDLNVGDAVFMINFIFRGGPAPDPTCFHDCTEGEQEPCYSGPPGTEGIGVCVAGHRICMEGFWGEWCIGELLPSAEICDGLDNDCDNIPDNNLTPVPCDLTEGVCAGAVRICGGTEGWLPCDASSYGPNYQLVETTCDGLDNDCNGVEDDMCHGSPHVDMWGCNADTCIIVNCETGYADNNGVYSDGCESPAPGFCLIESTIFAQGDHNPTNDCQYCNPATDQYNWTTVDCDDDDVCTDDYCDPGFGCQHDYNTGPCDLPHANGVCSSGDCVIGNCHDNWANCDDIESNGCEIDLAYTPLNWHTAEFLGSHDGDNCSGCGTDFTINGRGSHWVYIYMEECCDNPFIGEDVGIRVTLTPPAGMDYDLYLWEGASETIIDQSNNGAGQTDFVTECNSDNMGSDDSKEYVIEIRAYGGSSCQNWTLRIQSCP